MSKFLNIAEQGFIVLGLTTIPGILYRFPEVGLLPKNFVTVLTYGVWAILIILMCIFWKTIIRTLAQNISLCILILLSLCSCLWSEFPTYSLQIAMGNLMLSLFGIYIATRFSLKTQVQLISIALLVGATFSAIFALGFPTIGRDNTIFIGAWQGVYTQKNSLGNMMVLSSLTFFLLPKENSSLYKWFGFIFSLILMLLSTSKSSLVVSFSVLLIIIFYKNFKWQGKISVIFMNIGVLILGCVSIAISTYWIELLTSLGKDPSLTGRTPLWSYALARAMERPLFGYGLSAFWAPNSYYAVEAGQGVTGGYWIPPNVHNGILDLILDVGLVGVLFFLITYFTTFTQALKKAYETKNPENLWPLAYLIFLTMTNVTESRLLGNNNIFWVLYVTVACTMNQKNSFKNSHVKQKKYLHVT